jgi:hypothetical protein
MAKIPEGMVFLGADGKTYTAKGGKLVEVPKDEGDAIFSDAKTLFLTLARYCGFLAVGVILLFLAHTYYLKASTFGFSTWSEVSAFIVGYAAVVLFNLVGLYMIFKADIHEQSREREKV